MLSFTSALTKISEKIHRKPAKGGLVNALYVHAAVEELPPELHGVAGEVDVHFPWGSLLRAMARGDEAVLNSVRQICAPQASLKIYMSLDPERDRAEIERLGLPQISGEFLRGVLKPRYKAAGFEILAVDMFTANDWPSLQTSWAQRLRNNHDRSVVYMMARAIAPDDFAADERKSL
jgi:hypothetical protein